jgi:tetrapyrrole methylase family protein/MazG family protein
MGAGMSQHANFDAFCKTVEQLCDSQDGCPWNRVQTHQSIAQYLLEEAYECVDAIDKGDAEHLRDELGDVLLQVVLQSQIAANAGEFTIDDVCAVVNEKMIRRHPHVFARPDGRELTPDEVNALWEQVKAAERAREEAQAAERGGHPEPLLDSVSSGMPALIQAQKISRKAVNCGFEWDTVDDVWEQVFSEIDELKQATATGDKEAMQLELGDVLFSLVNVARKLNIDSEEALRASCRKFRARWAFMEGAAWSSGRNVEDLSFDELQTLWDAAKTAGH